MTVNEWKEKLEDLREKTIREMQAESRERSEEYEAYISQYRTYSYEQIRDYGHTWGPGIDDVAECEPNKKLYRLNKSELELLVRMLTDEYIMDLDIEMIFTEYQEWGNGFISRTFVNEVDGSIEYSKVIGYLLMSWRSKAIGYQSIINNESLSMIPDGDEEELPFK